MAAGSGLTPIYNPRVSRGGVEFLFDGREIGQKMVVQSSLKELSQLEELGEASILVEDGQFVITYGKGSIEVPLRGRMPQNGPLMQHAVSSSLSETEYYLSNYVYRSLGSARADLFKLKESDD